MGIAVIGWVIICACLRNLSQFRCSCTWMHFVIRYRLQRHVAAGQKEKIENWIFLIFPTL